MLGPLAPLDSALALRAVHMSAPALWVWVDLAVCEALVMEEEPGRGSECLLNQHFFDSVALENSGVEG